ncbi:Lrp/AsnC family transcriptional regulator [Amycolatopsis sp. WGS_07]|uniref:Lrp/AsnC family transcriptional regulator n=1 Tax=Amycolatopsis sp. WGS_07 TaxID=3076764 RepID=UPI00387310FA
MSTESTLTTADLTLVRALQREPRATWTRVGAVVGTDATTAARRWDRLHKAGLAWLTAYVTPPTWTVGYVDLACTPDRLLAVGEEVCRWPPVFSVERTTSDHQLFLGIAARCYHSMDTLVTKRLGVIPGVRSVRMAVATRIHREGGGWTVGPDQHSEPSRASLPLPQFWQDGSVRTIVDALGTDGRLSSAELARRCGVGESVVRRVLARLLRNGDLAFRCDLAHVAAGWPVIAGYRLDVPADVLDRVAAAVAALPETRLSAAVVGRGNLVVSTWLRNPADTTGYEARLLRTAAGVRVLDRAVTLTMPKRMGRLLDQAGRAVGYQQILPAGGHPVPGG